MSNNPDQTSSTDWKFWAQLTVDILGIIVPIIVMLVMGG